MSTARPVGADTQAIYRYVNAEGRTVYVNGKWRVPEAFRAKAKPVDLSQVSLNKELAAELDAAVEKQIARLVETDYCRDQRALASRSWWQTLWRRHGHLLLLGLAALIIIAVSPWVMRRVDPPVWGKVLWIALPLLAGLAAVSTAMVRTARIHEMYSEAAQPCVTETYRQRPKTHAARVERIKGMQQLLQRIEAAQRARAGQVERATGGKR